MNNEPEKENNQDDAIQETLDFSKPDFSFVPNENHAWRQQGPFLVCKSCEIVHAVHIGMDKLMVGLDSEGKPLLKIKSKIG